MSGRREGWGIKKRVATTPAKRATGTPAFQKVGWAKTAPLTAATSNALLRAAFQIAECSAGCGRYEFVTDPITASCNDSSTPPIVCSRIVAIPKAGLPCIKFIEKDEICGVGQPCKRDAKDEAGTLTCGDCKDEDNDGYSTCDGDCDDSNTLEGFNTNPGAPERCDNGRNDNCDAEKKVDEKPCCNAEDEDGDDLTECDGDCNDKDANFTDDCSGCGDDERQREFVCVTSGGFWLTKPVCDCDFPFQTDPGSPVLVDVNGDGFRLTGATGGVLFDLDGDGVRERLSWTAPGSDDAWLALDRDGGGLVESGRELFGDFTPQPPSAAPNGFLALAVYDRPEGGGDGDGDIDARDAVFHSLRLWRDADHDGVSEAGELHTLASLGVARIHLAYKESKRVDEHGNRFLYRAKVDGGRGSEVSRWAWDVFLVSAP